MWSRRLNTIVIEPNQKARACIIWMHGLGAGADDMAGLAKQLPLDVPVRHVALNASIRPVTLNQGMPMPAWYDILGMSFSDREDKAGILASEQMILKAIDAQIADGFASETIFLAGFSQGGAMALFTALRTTLSLGGV
ncbi:MAG: carboxylesterase, partial [Legionellaceae bacterium]|nr:carboxylesterase [Legionellaceae bacterium]